MEIELRPLSAGEILDRTFRLYRAQFGVFFGIATIAALIQTAGSAVQTFAVRYAVEHGAARAWVGGLGVAGYFFMLFVAVIAVAVVFAAIAGAVMSLHHGQSIGIESAYQKVLPQWFRYLRVAILGWFLTVYPFFLLGLVLTVVLIVPIALHGSLHHANAATIVGEIVGFFIPLLLIIPLCIWLACRYALCLVASAVEGLNARQSIKRSVVLSKGSRWRVFLLFLLVYILQIILAVALEAPIVGILVHMSHTHGQLPLSATIYQLAIGFLIISFVTPMYGIGLTVIYLDARIRKEGYDIELMMQRSLDQSFVGQPSAAVAGAQPGDSAPLAMG